MKNEVWKVDNGMNIVGTVDGDRYFEDIVPNDCNVSSRKIARVYGRTQDKCRERAALIASAPKMRECLDKIEEYKDKCFENNVMLSPAVINHFLTTLK